MAVKLYQPAFDQAKRLIKAGRFVHDDRDAWSEHQPSAEQENAYLEQRGFGEYARWYLGVDDEQARTPKGGTSFRTATSRRCIAAACSPLSRARANAGTPTSNWPSRTCTACSTR